MTVDYCDPDADSSPVAWVPSVGSTHWECIDGGVRDPTTPTSDNIYAGDGDENDQATVEFDESINDVDEATQIVIHTYGNNTTGNAPLIRIYCGAWEDDQTLEMVTGYTWFARTFTGSWSQSDLNGLLVRYTADSAYDKLEGTWVRACYAEVTYTEAVAGYGNKVNGVAAAQIAKVNGVAVAQISKVNGI